MAVYFFNEDIDFPPLNKKQVKKWLQTVVKKHHKTLGDINYIFTSDSYILKINQEHLKHDYYTDVITFDYTENNKISGDIYISLDTVKSNAELLNQDYNKEFNRVLIHGILHLIGFKDKNETDATEMRKQEELSLEILKNILEEK